MLGQSDYPVEFIPTEFKVNDNVRSSGEKLCGLEGEIREIPMGHIPCCQPLTLRRRNRIY